MAFKAGFKVLFKLYDGLIADYGLTIGKKNGPILQHLL